MIRGFRQMPGTTIDLLLSILSRAGDSESNHPAEDPRQARARWKLQQSSLVITQTAIDDPPETENRPSMITENRPTINHNPGR